MNNDDNDTQGRWGIPGTYVFDGRVSRRGYNLNKLAFSLGDAANRDAYRADEEAYLEKYRLDDATKDAVRRRDWLALTTEHGGNIYYMLKLGAAVGAHLYQMGAQMRHETYEEFLNTRNAKGAR